MTATPKTTGVTSPPPTVRFIGLRHAGWPVATNPRNGFQLYVSDADASRAQKFANEYNCIAVQIRSDRYAGVDVLITMLPNGDIVRGVLLGDKGIAKTLKRGMDSFTKLWPTGTDCFDRLCRRRHVFCRSL